MDFADTYKKLTGAIIEEHREIFERLDMAQLNVFMNEVIEAKHIFVYGTGRDL